MSRAQQAAVQQSGNNLLNTETGQLPLGGQAAAGWQSLLTNPGLTDAQKSAQTAATEGGIGAAFGSANQGAVNQAARTNNTAGLTSTEDALARQRMITSADAAAKNQQYFTEAARGDTKAALGGIGNLFATNLGGANTTLGTLAGNAKTPGFWDQVGQGLAGLPAQWLSPSAAIGVPS